MNAYKGGEFELDLLENCIFVVNARKVAEASSLRAAAGSRCHFVPPNFAKVTHQKFARRSISSLMLSKLVSIEVV